MAVLRYFITSKAKRSILRLFLQDVDKAHYTREAARLTDEPLNAVRRELGYLEKAGLLRSYKQGNLKYFEVVKEFPLLAEWRRIILETPDIAPAPKPRAPKKPAVTIPTAEAPAAAEAEQYPVPEQPILLPAYHPPVRTVSARGISR